MRNKWKNIVGSVIGGMSIAIVVTVGVTSMGRSAISELAGLAVAQTNTLWNSVKDAAAGDALSSGILAQATYMYNGVTFDRARGDTTNGLDVDVTRISGSVTPADAYANPTTANQMWSLNGVFNGTTWDRMRSATADALAVTGIQAVGNMGFNGGTWDRFRTATADALASTGIQTGNPSLFNGATFDRQDGISATNNTATTSIGAAYTVPLSTWSITNTPAVATAATVSRAAGGGTVRHVATSVTACVAANGTAQTPLLIHLRDGATGAGTIIRTWAISAVISASECIDLSGLNMTGTANTAMTIETAAAPATAVQATVTLTGYSTP